MYFKTLVLTDNIIDAIITTNVPTNDNNLSFKLTKCFIKQLKTKLSEVFKEEKLDKLLQEEKTQKSGNNYKTMINNIFNYTESSEESYILLILIYL